MIYGYARVSTKEQNLDLQLDELNANGCERIFEEKISGVAKERPELEKLIEQLRDNDTVVVYQLSRLGRSAKDLVNIVERIKRKGAFFKSIKDAINTDSATGKFIFNVFTALAQLERDMLIERTKAGLKAANDRGRFGGRPRDLSPEKLEIASHALSLFESGSQPTKIAKSLKVGIATIYRYINLAKEQREISDFELLSRLTSVPGMMGGVMTIRGNRFPAQDIIEMLQSGMSYEQILEEHPILEMDDIKASILYYKKESQ